MRFSQINPAIRFADRLLYTNERRLSKTYDCRLLYILEGEGEIYLDGEVYLLRPGTLVLFQAETAYRFTSRPRFLAIAVDFDLTGEFETDSGALSPAPIARFDPSASHGRFAFEDTDFLSVAYVNADGRRHLPFLETILDEYRGRRPYFAELASLRLKEQLLLLARSGFAAEGSARTAERVVAYISEHYAEPLTNESIAAVFGHDAAYLGRAVKRYTGEPLHRLLVRRRVAGAIRLLLTTDEPLEVIAEQVGFYGAAHLCAKCKALTGNSPSFYRKGK